MKKFLVLSGDGINCEKECALAINEAGGQATIFHINQLLNISRSELETFRGIIFPGGFSFGDELGSGQILALKFRHLLNEKLDFFVKNSFPILGICNGFQFLVKMGVLPGSDFLGKVALIENSTGQFINRWIKLNCEKSPCLWTKGISEIELPIRHGEGRLFVKEEYRNDFAALMKRGLAPMRYGEDVNGSFENIAGLCNEAGNIFGLMPHPEAALFGFMHPDRRKWSNSDCLGLKLFENAVLSIS